MDPIDNVEQVAENMQLYPLEHYLTGRSLLLSFDAQVTQLILSTSAFSFSSFYRPPPPPPPTPASLLIWVTGPKSLALTVE